MLLCTVVTYAQTIKGTVYEQENDKDVPLIGANVYWSGTTTGTITDNKGYFEIENKTTTDAKLVISYIGYTSDTISITDADKPLKIVLKNIKELEEVEVRSASTVISTIEPLNTQTMTKKELTKAACCNLSESFETNATVDVSYSDAITGAKNIQMLGLDGVYTQMMTENIPSIRGLSSTYGLGYIPGPWVQSIDISKGVGSVVNGYESVVGQINVELKKPENTDKFHLNLYANHMGRAEANLNYMYRINDDWSTMVMLHSDLFNTKVDMNNDSFLDIPRSNQNSFVWRMRYDAGKRVESMFGVKGLIDNKQGGQMSFNKSTDYLRNTFYGSGVNTNRVEAFAKTGFLFPDKPYKSIGTIVNMSYHDQKSFFGLNRYTGNQQYLYTNVIYQSIIKHTYHRFRTGGGYIMDNYNEQYNDSVFTRYESVPGVFGEYTYDKERFVVVAGFRADFHNLFGFIPTPRLHLKYNISKKTTLRVGGGRGFRVANIFAENTGIFVSSRKMIIGEKLRPEIAWNYGINLVRRMVIGGREGTISFDLYRTDFENQIVIDQFISPQLMVFSNLNGKSYANSFQTEFNYEVLKNLDLRLAYKWYDVKTSYRGQLIPKPYISTSRVLLNLAYSMNKDKWKFDFTTHWNGPKRLPETSSNPAEFTRASYSPSYFNFAAQVTRTFKKWELYLGGENLGNFRQPNPIVDAANPFGTYFDASMIWGPIFGRMIYSGIRYTIK